MCQKYWWHITSPNRIKTCILKESKGFNPWTASSLHPTKHHSAARLQSALMNCSLVIPWMLSKSEWLSPAKCTAWFWRKRISTCSDSSASLTQTSFTFFVMRKIESQMVAAINANKNWCSGNTMVKTDDANISRVFLHGNHIATIDDDSMMIMDGGWQSNTTKSRLNALCDAFCISGECVFQKDFTWYVRKFVGAINGQKVFKTEYFHSGYTFAWCLIDKNMCHIF